MAPEPVIEAIYRFPIAFIVLRTMLGFTPPEWAYVATERADIEISQGAARSIDRKIRAAPETPMKANRNVTDERIHALVVTACQLLTEGAPKVPKDILHRLDKADTKEGTISLQHLADFGAPYAMLLYERFLGRSFAADPSKQIDVFDFPDLGITVVGFCSCHNNDLLNRQAVVHSDCIAEAGNRLRDICLFHEPLRIAVWHHSTEGPPVEVDYMDPDIVQNLIDGGFSLGFHGHQHRPQFLDTRFRHGPDRRITVISAGTLCGGSALGFRRAYNVVEIDTEARKGCLHLREMQNNNLQMPIWGPRSLPPNRTSYLDFTFDSPPKTFVRPDRRTILLTKAQKMYDGGQLREAADVLLPLATAEPLGRRLFLQCLIRLDDGPAIMAVFDPPESAAEAIALMDSLWRENERQRLTEVLNYPLIAESDDGSIIEMRDKYAARLKK